MTIPEDKRRAVLEMLRALAGNVSAPVTKAVDGSETPE